MDNIGYPQFVGYRRLDLSRYLALNEYVCWKLTVPGGGERDVLAFGAWSDEVVWSELHLGRLIDPPEKLVSRFVILFPEQEAPQYSKWFGSWIGTYIGPADPQTTGWDSQQALEQSVKLSAVDKLGIPATSLGDFSLIPHVALSEYVEISPEPSAIPDDPEIIGELVHDSHDGTG